MESSFEEMWEASRDYVFRTLLALTRDVDLAEDCLQDTYLRAGSAIGTYRGGNPKAWLAAIAKNVFYAHARRKGFRSEESLEALDEQADDSAGVGSDVHFDLLTIRNAISDLAPKLRKALLMKHYADCDYREIAAYLSCTPTTAKHRVWRAMQKVRSIIGAEKEVDCSELRGPKILDWLYGALSPGEAAEIESHAALCAACRRNLSEMRRLSGALDKAEHDHRILTLIDLDELGGTTRYVWVKDINNSQDLMREWRWNRRPGWTIEYLALQGEPMEVHWPCIPTYPGYAVFEGTLPKPVPRGQMIDAMFVARPPAGSHWEAQPVSGLPLASSPSVSGLPLASSLSVSGLPLRSSPETTATTATTVWHYHHKHSPFIKWEALFIVTIRLPRGARLLQADPPPQKLSTRDGRTSLTWQTITEIVGEVPDDTKWQFEAHVEYALTPRDE